MGLIRGQWCSEMNKYIPFLKLKAGEFAAIKTLSSSLKNQLTPFLEIPFNKEATEGWLKDKLPKIRRKIEINLVGITAFYIDNYNIDSDLIVDGINNYQYILTNLKDFPLIPVVSIDRCPDHNLAVATLKNSGDVASNVIAIRLTEDDFINYSLIADEIQDELGNILSLFDSIDLILDCRMCLRSDSRTLATNIHQFTNDISQHYEIRKLIVSGSSIPASISELLSTESETFVDRRELEIFRTVSALLTDTDLYLGDYGTVL